MNTPKPLRELCAATTPGPECPECVIAAKKYSNIDRRMAARGNFGIVPASPVCEKHFNTNLNAMGARSQLIARLSPEVVLRVYTFLEGFSGRLHDPDSRGPCLCSQCEREREAGSLKRLLDGAKEERT